MALQPGSRIADRFEVVRVVGKGGYGAVYQAHDSKLRRTVAIKVLLPWLADHDRHTRRFLREARALSAIRHPNVVDIYDFGELPDGALYYVMEFLAGDDLDTVLRRDGPLSWLRARRILVQTVHALAAAHAVGIIHRDVKPANVFLVRRQLHDSDDAVKVVDFGIAKFEKPTGDSGPLTSTGRLLGTAWYMAPEQAGSRDVDHRTDVYGVGALMYHMLTNHLPFEDASLIAVLNRILHERPRPLRELAPDVPPWAEEIAMRCLSKDPTDRYQTMWELGVALDLNDVGGDEDETTAQYSRAESSTALAPPMAVVKGESSFPTRTATLTAPAPLPDTVVPSRAGDSQIAAAPATLPSARTERTARASPLPSRGTIGVDGARTERSGGSHAAASRSVAAVAMGHDSPPTTSRRALVTILVGIAGSAGIAAAWLLRADVDDDRAALGTDLPSSAEPNRMSLSPGAADTPASPTAHADRLEDKSAIEALAPNSRTEEGSTPNTGEPALPSRPSAEPQYSPVDAVPSASKPKRRPAPPHSADAPDPAVAEVSDDPFEEPAPPIVDLDTSTLRGLMHRAKRDCGDQAATTRVTFMINADGSVAMPQAAVDNEVSRCTVALIKGASFAAGSKRAGRYPP